MSEEWLELGPEGSDAPFDQGEVILAVRNSTPSSRTAHTPLDPSQQFLFYIAEWDRTIGKWRTTESAVGEPFYLGLTEPSHWKPIVPPRGS